MARMNSVSPVKVVFSVFVLLVLIAVICVVGYFTNGFTGDFKTFYVVRGDKTIMARETVFLPDNEDVRFDVKYTFGIVGGGDKSFSVKVVPNATREADFEFTVDGSVYAYSGVKDLTSAFDIKLYADYFTINIYDNIYLGDFLSKLYSGSIVEAPEIFAAAGYLTLIVTSYNGQSSIYLDLSISLVPRIVIRGGDIIF